MTDRESGAGPRKRSAANAESPLPSDAKKPKRTVRASTALQNAAQVDLVYPFWHTPDVNGGLNPPFLDSNGPLVDQNGTLYLNVSKPIVIKNRAVDLAHDDSLAVNGNGELEVNIEPNGPLELTPNGLDVKVDQLSLEVVDWELCVKLDPDGCIDTSTDGLVVNIDETLLVDSRELGVHLNPIGPITADSDGLDLEIDPQTLQVDATSGAGVLGVHLKNQGGLQAGVSGIGVAVDKSLQIQSNTVEVKPDPNGPLTVDQDGLNLNIDTTTLSVTGGKLSVISSGGKTVPTYTSGFGNLSTYTATFVNSSSHRFNCSYYLQQWNVSGLLLTSLYLKIDSTTMGARPSDTAAVNAKWFTFWVSSFAACNPSNLSTGTVNPPSLTMTQFEPMANRSLSSSWNYAPNSYYEPESGEFQLFSPVATNQWNPGNVGIRVLPVQVSSGLDRYTLLCFNFQCTNASIFDPQYAGTMIVGPVMYTCPAATVPS